jgi:pseudouridylate synthase
MLNFSPEIAAALAEKRPIVALESTIIAHGMPFPQNVETALDVEKMVRASGAIPATIAILNGKMQVGLDENQLEILGKSGRKALKISRRDLPFVLMRPDLVGATTVASTMIIAEKAGIPIFATGGIGGVHRGAETTFDISADLQELARTSVAVVSAGAKSILDLRLTVEYLETMGVPVLGFKTDDFPAFYTQKSGLNVDFRLETAAEIADFLQKKWQIAGLAGGVLIANPIPEKYSMPAAEIEKIIETAVKMAAENGIRGKETTPFLLKKIKDLSNGESLESNIALVLNNARLAAEISVHFTKINK